MAQFDLKGFDSVFDTTLNNELQDNVVEFLDWALLQKGNYFNVTLGETSPNGYDYSQLKLASSNSNYTAGTAWEGFRENWIWQSGITYSPTPLVGDNNNKPGISGVYVDSAFYPTTTVGDYAHRVDYLNGRIVFDSPIPTGSLVQAEFSYKWINVIYANGVPWLRDIQYRTYDQTTGFHLADKGEWDQPAEFRIQLPAIAIEVVPRRVMKGWQLGGGQWVDTDVLFHCIAEDETTRNKMVDIISFQNDKTIYKFDSNKIGDSNAFPLDYRGQPVSGALRYPDLATDYIGGTIRLKNASVQGMEAINSNLYAGIVKLTAETAESKI
jgi:hypothetical protein